MPQIKKKNGNTNLLIVTSAACSGQTAGCQTLKGTEAEFNASCQGSLMWLSPPARAGIVKLSGSGKDAQKARRDAPLACPRSRSIAADATGGGKRPPSSPQDPVCVCVYVGRRVCMCACVNSDLCLHYSSAVSHCGCCWLGGRRRCFEFGWDPHPRPGPLPHYRPIKVVFKVTVLLTGNIWACTLLKHYSNCVCCCESE